MKRKKISVEYFESNCKEYDNLTQEQIVFKIVTEQKEQYPKNEVLNIIKNLLNINPENSDLYKSEFKSDCSYFI